MGVVYRGLDPATGRRVAVKVILQGGDESDRERFAAEVEALRRIKHPGLIEIVEAGSARGRPYIAMEFVEGPSLDQRLKTEGTLEVPEAARLIERLAGALTVAHQAGVIHRDLKPANVILGPAGPVLADFGLAKLSHREALTLSGQIVGTPGYLAPEQADGLGQFGPWTDVYGLGATLFAALCGRPPFQAQSLTLGLLAVLEQPPPDPRALRPEVPRALAEICLRCLAKAPADRYPDAEALAEALVAYRIGEEGRSSQKPKVLISGALAALLLAGGVAAWLWSPREAPEAPLTTSGSPTPSGQRTAREWFALARERAKQGDAPGEIEALKRTCELEPKDVQALDHLIGALARSKRDQENVEYLERLVALSPTTEHRWWLAKTLLKLGQTEGPERLGKELLAADPDDTYGLQIRLKLQLARKEYRGAIETLDRWVLLEPSPESHFVRAQTWIVLKEFERAGKDLDDVLALDPHHATAYFRRGILRQSSGDLSEARADFERALREGPELEREVLYWQGVNLLQLGNAQSSRARDELVQAAAAKLQRGLDLNPGDLRHKTQLAMCLHVSGKHPAALALLDEVLRAEPARPRALDYRAQVYVQLKRYDEARADSEALLQLLPPTHPLSSSANSRLAKLRLLQGK